MLSAEAVGSELMAYKRGRRGPNYVHAPTGLRALRIELGVTQAEAALAFGCSERSWRTWEKGGWNPSGDLSYIRARLLKAKP